MASASSATRTVLRLEHEDVHLSFSLCSEAAGYTDDELVLVVHGYNGLNIEAKNGLPPPQQQMAFKWHFAYISEAAFFYY